MTNFRLADSSDLPQLKEIYRNIVNSMYQNNIEIWDDIYPCEFFEEDIEHNRLYILEEGKEIISAFALCSSNAGAEYVEWEKKDAKALYLDRFGVNVNYLRKGIGSIMLDKAIHQAKENGAEYLRLFVVDINEPAQKLYIKNDFKQVEGIYDEVIDEELTLHEYGFEVVVQ